MHHTTDDTGVVTTQTHAFPYSYLALIPSHLKYYAVYHVARAITKFYAYRKQYPTTEYKEFFWRDNHQLCILDYQTRRFRNDRQISRCLSLLIEERRNVVLQIDSGGGDEITEAQGTRKGSSGATNSLIAHNHS